MQLSVIGSRRSRQISAFAGKQHQRCNEMDQTAFWAGHATNSPQRARVKSPVEPGAAHYGTAHPAHVGPVSSDTAIPFSTVRRHHIQRSQRFPGQNCQTVAACGCCHCIYCHELPLLYSSTSNAARQGLWSDHKRDGCWKA